MKTFIGGLFIAALFYPSFVSARVGHGGVATPVNTPVLNDVAVNFGQYTAGGYGAVRLSSVDDAVSYALPGYGLDVLSSSGTPCATWTTTLNSGTSGHFNLISGIAEGSSAITPTPTATGVSAHLNGGPYVFNVTCTDAGGHASNTAHLTYNIILKAANVGNNTGNFPAVTSGFASFATTSGYQILASTGMSQPLTAASWAFGCPVQCDVTWADTTKPGLLPGLTPGGTAHLRIHDFQFTGAPASMCAAVCLGLSTDVNKTMILENVHVAFLPQQAATASQHCFQMGWINSSIINSECDWVATGIRIWASNLTVTGYNVDHYTVNAFDVSNAENVTMSDALAYSPEVTTGGFHADCMQLANGAVINGWTVRRLGCLTAGGDGATQGIIFPGHQSYGDPSSATTQGGYVDDGTGAHGAGHIVTFCGTNPAVFYQGGGNNGARFYIPTFVGGPGAPTVTTSGVNTGTGGPSATLNGITDQVIGSPVDCKKMGGFEGENMDFQGVINTGWSTHGWSDKSEYGTSNFKNFAYISQFNSTPYVTQSTVDVSGTTATVHGPVTSNAQYNAGLTAGGVGIGWGIHLPGVVTSVFLATRVSTSTPGDTFCVVSTTCVYTLNTAPGNTTGAVATYDPPVGNPPALSSQMGISQENCDLAWMHTGTNTIKDGWSQAGTGYSSSTGGAACGAPPANTTFTHSWNMNTAAPATAFANGDPTTAFQALTSAQWNAQTPAQKLATYCHYMLPKTGGPLDNGDGTFAAAFKLVGGQGEWFDGTVIPGCS